MGYKNSIDSATMVNKCLELIEAHYLFDIPYDKLKVLVHPEAIVHSAIEYDNYVTQLNLFKNDMKIPILNFLYLSKIKYQIKNDTLSLKHFNNLHFQKVTNEIFPIYHFFLRMHKTPQNIIKFNIGNEFAVNLFKSKKIKYTDIYKIIKKVTSLNLNSSVNTIKNIVNYHEEIEKKIHNLKIFNI